VLTASAGPYHLGQFALGAISVGVVLMEIVGPTIFMAFYTVLFQFSPHTI
jgi:hypothetical protein